MNLNILVKLLIGIFVLIMLTAPSVSAGDTTANQATLMWTFHKETNFNDIDISPDATHIIAGTADAKIYMLDINGKVIWENSVDGSVSGVAVANGGKYSAVGTKKGTLYVYDITGTPIWTKQLGEVVYDVDMTADGQYMTVGSNDGCLYLYQINGVQVWYQKIGGDIYGVAISEDGNIVAAGKKHFEVSAYDMSGNRLWTQKTSDQINDVDASDDGSVIVAGCADGRFYSYKGSDGTVLWNYIYLSPINGVASDKFGSYIACAVNDKYGHLLSGTSKSEVFKYVTFGDVNGVGLTKDSSYMAIASADGNVYFISLPYHASQIYTTSPTAAPTETQNIVSSTGNTVSVSSTPTGAQVYLDNVYKGVTPMSLMDIPMGSHVVTLTLAGYQTQSTDVTFTAQSGQSSIIALALVPSGSAKSPIMPYTIIAAAFVVFALMYATRRD